MCSFIENPRKMVLCNANKILKQSSLVLVQHFVIMKIIVNCDGYYALWQKRAIFPRCTRLKVIFNEPLYSEIDKR
jgi:hypothetical protein